MAVIGNSELREEDDLRPPLLLDPRAVDRSKAPTVRRRIDDSGFTFMQQERRRHCPRTLP